MRGQEEPRSDDATAVDAEINSQRRRLSRRQTLDLLTFERLPLLLDPRDNPGRKIRQS